VGNWLAVDDLIAERDPHCRGVLLLGASVPIDSLREALRAARASRACRGFAVGRSIFGDPSRAWLEGRLGDDALRQAIRARYDELVRAFRDSRCTETVR